MLNMFGHPFKWCWIEMFDEDEWSLIVIKLLILYHSTFLLTICSLLRKAMLISFGQLVQQYWGHCCAGNTNLHNSATFCIIQQGGQMHSTSLLKNLLVEFISPPAKTRVFLFGQQLVIFAACEGHRCIVVCIQHHRPSKSVLMHPLHLHLCLLHQLQHYFKRNTL